ncbi:hypothetical protein FKM82_009333 [Ascaphus truei]
MSLVGMATKPLHVRRLQKALRDWATNPGLFNQPTLGSAPVSSSIPLFKISETVGRAGRHSNGHPNSSEGQGKGPGNFGPQEQREQSGKRSPLLMDRRPWTAQVSPEPDEGDDEDVDEEEDGRGEHYAPPGESLEAEMVQVVSESVERLMKGLPQGDTGEAHSLLKLNKKLGRSLGHIFHMSDGDRRKEQEIRRHSAIYGRSESKRREGKRLTLHEAPELPLQADSETGITPIRHGLEEDSGSISGESMDGHLQAVAVRIPSSPGAPPTEVSLALQQSAPWSRQLLQQTLMDEGLRLARLVSRDRLGRLSLCVPGTPHIPECEDGGSESCPSLPVSPQITELRPGTCKGQEEANNQH